jgi:hypothetical protein
MYFRPVKDSRNWANYLCKSTEFKGKESFHKNKVVLFARHIGLEKHNEIGNFWQPGSKPQKPTPQQKQQKREHDHKMAEAVNDSLVRDAALHLASTTGVEADVIAKRYANNLIIDPTLYQAIADDAYEYRVQELASERDDDNPDPLTPRTRTFDRYIVGPFVFSPAPVPPKPPVRKKAKVKQPFPKFDPANCFTL